MNRAKEMLQIAADYIRKFYPKGVANYDETECDGYCVADDCEIAIADLEQQLQQAHRDATEEVAKAHKRGWKQAKREAEVAVRR